MTLKGTCTRGRSGEGQSCAQDGPLGEGQRRLRLNSKRMPQQAANDVFEMVYKLRLSYQDSTTAHCFILSAANLCTFSRSTPFGSSTTTPAAYLTPFLDKVIFLSMSMADLLCKATVQRCTSRDVFAT